MISSTTCGSACSPPRAHRPRSSRRSPAPSTRPLLTRAVRGRDRQDRPRTDVSQCGGLHEVLGRGRQAVRRRRAVDRQGGGLDHTCLLYGSLLLERNGRRTPPLPSPASEAAGRGRGWGALNLAMERKPREQDTRIPRARNLRLNTTTAERKLWWHLRRVAPARSHFRRQATIGPYYVDFACHDLRLVIELDGGQHGHPHQRDNDAVRTEFLNSRGYRVLRFWNNDVLTNIDGVLSVIQSALDDAVSAAPPPPTPPRHAARGRRGQTCGINSKNNND